MVLLRKVNIEPWTEPFGPDASPLENFTVKAEIYWTAIFIFIFADPKLIKAQAEAHTRRVAHSDSERNCGHLITPDPLPWVQNSCAPPLLPLEFS